VDFAITAKHPIKGGFARQIKAFIGQSWHDLGWRQVRVFRLMADIPYLCFFIHTQAIRGHWPYCFGAAVTGSVLPPPPGTQADVHFTAGDGTSCATDHGFINQQDEPLPFISRRQSSPSVSP
jgi:hypothetical protein